MLSKHMTIGRKIGFGFAVMLLLIVVLLGMSHYAQLSSSSRFTNLLQKENVVITHANAAKVALLEARRNEKELLYVTDDAIDKSANKFIDQLHGEFDSVNSLVAKSGDPKLIEISSKLVGLTSEYQKKFQAMVAAPAGQERMIAALMVRKTAQEMETLLKDLLGSVTDRIEKETVSTQSYIALMGSIVLATGIFAIIAGGVLAFILPRAISRPLNLMQGIITEVEQSCDLSRRIPENSHDEVGKTAIAFNSMLASLQSALSNTNAVMGAVAAGDFSQRITVDAHGDLAQLKLSVNGSVDKIQLTMNALTDVMNALREGDFSKRVDAKVEGEFKNAVDQAMQAM